MWYSFLLLIDDAHESKVWIVGSSVDSTILSRFDEKVVSFQFEIDMEFSLCGFNDQNRMRFIHFHSDIKWMQKEWKELNPCELVEYQIKYQWDLSLCSATKCMQKSNADNNNPHLEFPRGFYFKKNEFFDKWCILNHIIPY